MGHSMELLLLWVCVLGSGTLHCQNMWNNRFERLMFWKRLQLQVFQVHSHFLLIRVLLCTHLGFVIILDVQCVGGLNWFDRHKFWTVGLQQFIASLLHVTQMTLHMFWRCRACIDLWCCANQVTFMGFCVFSCNSIGFIAALSPVRRILYPCRRHVYKAVLKRCALSTAMIYNIDIYFIQRQHHGPLYV